MALTILWWVLFAAGVVRTPRRVSLVAGIWLASDRLALTVLGLEGQLLRHPTLKTLKTLEVAQISW